MHLAPATLEATVRGYSIKPKMPPLVETFWKRETRDDLTDRQKES